MPRKIPYTGNLPITGVPMKFASPWLCAGLLAATLTAWAAQSPATAPAPPKLDPFANLPAPTTRPDAAKLNPTRVHPGTDGLALPTPAPSGTGRTSIAILGDLAPGDPGEREKFLRLAVSEINLLRPEAVLTVGNLIPGLTRSGLRYVQDAQHTRTLLDALKMPWFPCAGITDVVSGTRLPATATTPGDRRFEDLYQRYVGPLYFSADIGGADAAGMAGGTGGIHAIILDSEEGVGAGNSLSDTQLRWLKDDLTRTFNSGRAQGVLLLLHRPLWREEKAGGNWQKVHDLLVEFNRRPIASFEDGLSARGGGAGGGIMARGPRVLAVFAGSRQAYDQEPTRDGIRYHVLGPTAAAPRPGESAAEALRHFTLVKLDAAGEMHTALVRLGGSDEAQMILPDDVVTAPERAILDAIAAWNDATLGIDGIIDERGESPAGKRLTFHAANPLPEALDIQLRLAPGNWEFTAAPFQRHLTAAGTSGARASSEFGLRRIRAGSDRPVVEAVIRWPDARGRVHEIVLPRPLAVAPSVDLPVSDKPIPLDAPDGWPAPSGTATAWSPRPDAPRKTDPAITLRADPERILVRVHVADDTASYWPTMKLDPAWGGLPSDAVSLAWAKSDQQVHRIWVLPYAPKPAGAPGAAPEIWTNTGLGDQQTNLLRLDPNSGIQASLKLEPAGYTLTFALPRKLICDEIPATQPAPAIPLLTPPPPPTRLAATTLLNVAVYDNDETARTWTKSWTLEEAGPEAWAKVRLLERSTPP